MVSADDVVFEDVVEPAECNSGCLEHFLVEEEGVRKCVLTSNACDEQLVSEWMTAEQGSFVAVPDVQ